MKLRPTESQIAQQIVDYLRLHGWRVHRLEADIRGPKARPKREDIGTPDYIAVRQCAGPGGAFDVWYVEVKRPGGRLRRSQQIWIDDARKRGWNVAIASSIDDLLAAGMPGLDDCASPRLERSAVRSERSADHRAVMLLSRGAQITDGARKFACGCVRLTVDDADGAGLFRESQRFGFDGPKIPLFRFSSLR